MQAPDFYWQLHNLVVIYCRSLRTHLAGDVQGPVRERGRGVVAADDALQLLAQPVQVGRHALPSSKVSQLLTRLRLR